MSDIETTIVVDDPGFPRVTLSRKRLGSRFGGFTCTVEVDGLEPQRTLTFEEQAVGITSLDPPTVDIGPLSERRATMVALIDACVRAVCASATSTLDGDTGGPAGIVACTERVSRAVRKALRLMDEQI